jgi:DNA invertase Pin-like site-specific DNA recombinase
MRQPVAYLRKSRVTSDRHVSWEVQLAAVNELAARNGDVNPLVLSDWNKSGRKGADARPGYAQLIEMIEAGQVSALYSYSLSRLSRSLSEFARLVDLCLANGVTIRLQAEPFLDFTTAAGRLMVAILAAFAQMEAELAQERARDTVAVRRARGDKIGAREFEDTDAVVKAYDQAGSILGAARLLTAWGVPTRNGRSIWQPTSVRGILKRVAPDIMPSRPERGVKKNAPFMFYRLLRCHCGRFLTGVRYKSGPMAGYVSYRCLQGRVDVLHGPQSVPETAVLQWAIEEAALLTPPDDVIQLAEDGTEKRNALRDRMTRLGRAFVDQMIPESEYADEKAQLERELASLEDVGRVVTLEPISWDRDPKDLNSALRAIWRFVQMDENQRPAFAEWVLPEWRAAQIAA